MKKFVFVCALAALLLVPVGASADDLTARLSRGRGLVSLQVDGGSIEYSILTNEIGNLTGAEIRQGSTTVLDLGITGVFGSAQGAVDGSGIDLADLQANPAQYSVVVTGTGGSLDGTLRSAGESSSGGGGGAPVDLDNFKTKAKKSGKLIARVRNRSDTASAAASVTFFLSENDMLDSDDTQIGAASLASIPAGAARKATVRIDYPEDLSGKRRYIISVADPADINQDPDRSNNSSSKRRRIP